MQPYLEKVNICKFSRAFSKFRVSSHRLEIEAGRWTKPRAIPRDDSKCHICEILEYCKIGELIITNTVSMMFNIQIPQSN